MEILERGDFTDLKDKILALYTETNLWIMFETWNCSSYFQPHFLFFSPGIGTFSTENVSYDFAVW